MRRDQIELLYDETECGITDFERSVDTVRELLAILRFMKRNGPVVSKVPAEIDDRLSSRKRSGKQLSESMQKGIAANFAKCWRKYLVDGEVKDFLVRSSSLFPSHQYGVQYTSIAKQVLLERPIDSNLESISQSRTTDKNVFNATEQAKVAQRCLMAIGGLWCHRDAIPAIKALTAACVEIGESQEQRLSPDEEVHARRSAAPLSCNCL
jgi:hypothetical protein